MKAMLLGVLLVQGLVLPAGSMTSDWLKVFPANGYAPPTLVILTNATEKTQLCASGGESLVACRSVEEFRQWVKERAPITQMKK